MHIAIGYNWFVTAAGYHIERALRALGHQVTYVGLPCATRAGYDSGVNLVEALAALPQPVDLYLWIDPAGRYFPIGIEELSIPTACYLIDVHLGSWRPQAARFFDVVFLAQKDYVTIYQDLLGHGQVHWLPLGAAGDVHRPLGLPRIYEVGFVGNLSRAHKETARARRLRLIAAQFRTNDFYRFYTPDQVGQVYNQARIVFNTSIAGDVTMRVFEASACGAMVLTDATANGLETLFSLGQEIITYDDDADLLDKTRYYLAHEEERAAIAAAGQRRTLGEHLYTHRAAQLVEAMAQPDLARLAPLRSASPRERWRARQTIYTHLHMLDALLDVARAQELGPLGRAWAAAPCLLRRLMR
jgi:hypothetical protein